jgi:fumarate hydratase class I
MTIIREHDFIDSVADALQFISYFHPLDFVKAIHQAYEMEQNPAAKDAMAQILINSRMCAQGHRPICQDTGIVTVFLKIGMNVQWEASMSVSDMVNAGVRRAYLDPDNILRASILEDPAGARKNTKDNTPAVIHMEVVEGDTVDVRVAAKGGGSENKARLVMLNPSDNIVDWVVKTLPTMGAGWCPPGMLGIGIGGTAEKAAVLAKEALMEPIDIQELRQRGASNRVEELRLEIMDAVNKLGIGAQGLGGLTTVVDVKIKDYPTHAASLPVAMIPNCAATRHAHFVLDGSGPALQTPPNVDDWPDITWEAGENVKRVNLDTVTEEEAAAWRPGDTLLLYVTDHGRRGKEDVRDATISLWHEHLSVSALRELLARLDPDVRVVMLMSQCFSGSFANVLVPDGFEWLDDQERFKEVATYPGIEPEFFFRILEYIEK